MANNENLSKTGNKGKGAELVVRIRKHIWSAFDIVDKDAELTGELGINAILAREFKANPLKFIDIAAKFTPKDINAEIIRTIDVNKLSDSELAEIVLKTQAYINQQDTALIEHEEQKEVSTH